MHVCIPLNQMAPEHAKPSCMGEKVASHVAIRLLIRHMGLA